MTFILSQAEQDYLKAIYKLTRRQERATTNEIAQALEIQAASVTGMIQKLSQRMPALVDYQKRAGACLTPEGELEALQVLRHHRIIETFLHDKLGYSWDEVHEEAERLEHAMSRKLVTRLAQWLDNPTVDPHGDPIPNDDLEMPATISQQPLTTLRSGQQAIIQRIHKDSTQLLQFLAQKGLVPTAHLTILSYSDIDENIQLQVEGYPQPITIGGKVSQHIYVTLL